MPRSHMPGAVSPSPGSASHASMLTDRDRPEPLVIRQKPAEQGQDLEHLTLRWTLYGYQFGMGLDRESLKHRHQAHAHIFSRGQGQCRRLRVVFTLTPLRFRPDLPSGADDMGKEGGHGAHVGGEDRSDKEGVQHRKHRSEERSSSER
jgi:hypothetical protein